MWRHPAVAALVAALVAAPAADYSAGATSKTNSSKCFNVKRPGTSPRTVRSDVAIPAAFSAAFQVQTIASLVLFDTHNVMLASDLQFRAFRLAHNDAGTTWFSVADMLSLNSLLIVFPAAASPIMTMAQSPSNIVLLVIEFSTASYLDLTWQRFRFLMPSNEALLVSNIRIVQLDDGAMNCFVVAAAAAAAAPLPAAAGAAAPPPSAGRAPPVPGTTDGLPPPPAGAAAPGAPAAAAVRKLICNAVYAFSVITVAPGGLSHSVTFVAGL